MCKVRLAGAVGALTLLLQASASPATRAGAMQEIVAAINSGNQKVFERFAADHYAQSTLKESSANQQGAALARLFTDTGGLIVERIVNAKPDVIQAEGRDKITGSRQCLILKLSSAERARPITEFTVRALYDAGTELMPPSPVEVVSKLSRIAAQFDARGTMSGVMLIGQGERILFERAYGFASISHRNPMTTRTGLSLASIGKVLTGVAVARLVDQKKLSYDDKVGQVLPDYHDKIVRDSVTIRQLLSHTSGLGPLDYYQTREWDSARPLLRSVSDYLSLIAKGQITVGSPRGQYLYSNSGYVILGAIIEKVSGESFYDYVAREVFSPARMSESFYPEAEAEEPRIAEPLTNLFSTGPNEYLYRLGRPRRATYELAARGGPQGGASMTARDLFRFYRAFHGGKLVSSARKQEMFTPSSPAGAGATGLSGDVREGLGTEVVRQNGHLFFGHTGGDLGVAASAYWYPNSDYTIIVLTNRDPRAARILTNFSRALLTRQTLAGATPPGQHCADLR